MAFEEIASTNLVGVGNALIPIVSGILKAVIIIAIMGVVAVILYLIGKFLSFIIDVEIWERKGTDLIYWGDDRAKKITKKGVSYLLFLKNRGEFFRDRVFPDSQFLYKKRMFGSKLKFLIDGDNFNPMIIKLSNPHGLVTDVVSASERISYMQRMDAYHDRFKGQGMSSAQKMVMVLGVTSIGVILFGLFVIWQSNVATAEATKALAGNIAAVAKGAAQSLPIAP